MFPILSRRHRSPFAPPPGQSGALAGGVLALLVALMPAAQAQTAPTVAVSIAPLHSLVAQVMGDTADPHLIVEAAASPHGHALSPSDARALSEADLVVWVGPALESFLVRPLETLGDETTRLAVLDLPGIRRLAWRDGSSGAHDHGDHQDHEDHAEHEAHAEHQDEHQDEHAHVHAGDTDPHLWLDPANARVIVAAVAEHLSAIDPAHAAQYRANAKTADKALEDLDTALAARLAPVRNRPFIVFHDAYQYFEAAYDLTQAGVVVLAPDTPPGAAQMARVRTTVTESKVACLFAEPQFPRRTVEALAEGTPARTAILDPLGAAHPPGPDLYPALMRDLTEALASCLDPMAESPSQ